MSSPSVPRIHRWTGLSAVAAVGLFAVGNALWAFEQPDPGASGPELVEFYGDLSTRIVVGGLLSLTSIAVLVVLAAALRRLLIEVEQEGFIADLAYGGLLFGLAPGVGAEAVNMAAALRAGDGELTEPLALALFDISYMLGSYASGLGFGVLSIAIGAAALRTGRLLPGWLAIAAIAIGVALVTPLAGYAIGEYTVAPTMVLLLVLGVRLLSGSALRAPEASPASR